MQQHKQVESCVGRTASASSQAPAFSQALITVCSACPSGSSPARSMSACRSSASCHCPPAWQAPIAMPYLPCSTGHACQICTHQHQHPTIRIFLPLRSGQCLLDSRLHRCCSSCIISCSWPRMRAEQHPQSPEEMTSSEDGIQGPGRAKSTGKTAARARIGPWRSSSTAGGNQGCATVPFQAAHLIECRQCTAPLAALPQRPDLHTAIALL